MSIREMTQAVREILSNGSLTNSDWDTLADAKGHALSEGELEQVANLKNAVDSGRLRAHPWIHSKVEGWVAKGPEVVGEQEVDTIPPHALATRQAQIASQRQLAKPLYTRPLSTNEIETAKRVFGDSLPYDEINVGVLPNGMRAYKRENTIFIPADRLDDVALFLHELAHIWKDHHPSLVGRHIHGIVAYSWDRFINAINSGLPFEKLEVEQQAMLLQQLPYLGVAVREAPPVQEGESRSELADYAQKAVDFIKSIR